MNFNMQEALPEETKEDYQYKVGHVEWYDERELSLEDPSKGHFEDQPTVKREETALSTLLKDYKSLLDRKKDILTY